MSKQYFIYRYVDRRTSEVLYIGKTKRDLRLRISEHESELKFLPYLSYADISYYILGSRAAMDVHEKYWIQTLLPPLNVVDILREDECAGMGFILSSVGWKPYDTYVPQCMPQIPFDAGRRIADAKSYDAVIETEEEKLCNWEVFLEMAFDAYVNDSLDVRKDTAVVSWDLDTYPLPDSVSFSDDADKSSCFGIYHNAVFIPSQNLYEVHVDLSWLLVQFRCSASYLKEERRKLALKRLSAVG